MIREMMRMVALCALTAGATETALVPLACQDARHLMVDKSILGKPLTIAGRTFQSGYGAHGTGLIPFDIPHSTDVMVFSGSVGIDDDEDKIEGDGVAFVVSDGSSTLWKSGRLMRGDAARSFSVSLKPGVRRVYLQTFAGKDNWSDHCDWCDLLLRPSSTCRPHIRFRFIFPITAIRPFTLLHFPWWDSRM